MTETQKPHRRLRLPYRLRVALAIPVLLLGMYLRIVFAWVGDQISQSSLANIACV
jgi:hypothetical protein